MKLSTVILTALFIVGCGTIVTHTGSNSNYKLVEKQAQIPETADYPTARPMPAPAPMQVVKTLEIQQTESPKYKVETVGGSGSTTTSVKDDIHQQLFNVSMVFTIPISANIDDEINAEFIVDPKKTEDEIKNLVKDQTGQVITDKIDVSRTITAKLIAPNFKVSPSEDVRQALSMTEPTKWSWILTATKEGDQTVQLRVVAHILIEGERVERELQTFSRDLTVTVTPEQKFSNFVNQYLEFIVGSLIIPFVLWLFSYIKKRKR